MKQVFAIVLLIMINTTGWGQVNPNASTYHGNDTTKLVDIREKLVQLAMQNPNYEVADRNVNKSLYELRKAKGSWLGLLSLQGNVNEFTVNDFTGNNTGIANFYPKYNISLTVPMDVFSTKKNDIKIAKENYLIAEANRNDKYRQLRAEVLTRYEDYLMHKERLAAQVRITQDENIIFISKERDFNDGIINQEEYTRFSKAYSQARLLQIEYDRNAKVAKYELERLIGMTLEEALATK